MDGELKLIGTVELRLALATTDAQLEKALGQFLCPLLLKLASPYPQSRDAIIKIIGDISPRIKTATSLRLPWKALLDQIKSPRLPQGQDPSAVRIYTAMFFDIAITRLSAEEQVDVIPQVLSGISNYQRTIQAKLFSIFLKILPSQFPESFKLELDETDANWLETHVAQVFMLTLSNGDVARANPGLSVADYRFYSVDAGKEWTQAQLTQAKSRLLAFIDLLPSPNQPLPLLIATTDPSSSISDPATTKWKKLPSPIKTAFGENTNAIKYLVELCIGTSEFPPLEIRAVTAIVADVLQSPHAQTTPGFDQLVERAIQSNHRPLKSLVLQYLVRNSVSAPLASSMLTNVKEEIVQAEAKHTAAAQLSMLYEAYGHLLTANDGNAVDFSAIEFLFRQLDTSAIELRQTVSEVLGRLTRYLGQFKSDPQLRNLLKRAILTPQDSAVRFMAVKYLNLAFPFDDAEARVLCVVAASTSTRSDTLEEAQRGLHPHWFALQSSANTTEFVPTAQLLGSGVSVEFPSLENYMAVITTSDSPVDDKSAYSALEFAVKIVVMTAVRGKKTVVVVDDDWETRVTRALATDSTVRRLVSEFLATESNSLSLWFDCVVKVIAHQPDKFAEMMYTMVSMSPATSITGLVPQLPQLMTSVGDRGGVSGASVIAIVASDASAPTEQIWNQLDQRPLVQAAILGRLYLRQSPLRSTIPIVNLETSLKQMWSGPSGLSQALEALSQLARFGAIERFSAEFIDEAFEMIKSKVKKHNENAVTSLGDWSIAFPNTDTSIEEVIYDSSAAKQVEFVFASGEALAASVAGWQAVNIERKLDIMGTDPTTYLTAQPQEKVETAVTKVLEFSRHTRPSLRRAACIWLLSLVEFCGHLDPIKQRASDLQVAFMRFIADRDDLVQEAASRGLARVFELGSADMKDTLVKQLLKSFTDANQSRKLTSGSVDEDTELFDTPDLQTGDGGAVHSYRDVLSLASDVGDPSLVYKFMALAQQRALWSSRRGMAFGLGAILSKVSLDDMLASNPSMALKLVPKLYCYRFDPYTSVASVMTQIWKMVVGDDTAIIAQYFDAIVAEALKGMSDKEWRTREAATAALASVLGSVSPQRYFEKLPDIWTMAFRAIDDIKESVRKQGDQLAKQLAGMVVRLVEAQSPGAESALDTVIPFLLGGRGLGSDAEEVRQFALDTLLKLCGRDSAVIRKYVPQLIDELVQLMSTLEPQVVNYVYLNADKYGLDKSALDQQRLSGVGRSPLMDAVDKLVTLVDDDVATTLIPKLIASAKSTVGLPSKVGCAKTMVLLATRRRAVVAPYAEKGLTVCARQARDGNLVVASAFAGAAGHWARLAPVTSVARYVDDVAERYYSADDDDQRMHSAIAIDALAKYGGGDRIDAVSSSVLPLSFVAKFDSGSAGAIFERVWDEHTSSASRGVRLYYDEIIGAIGTHARSASYHTRRTMARAASAVAEAVNDTAGLTATQIKPLITMLIDANQGKSWEGKHLFFDALVTVACTFGESLDDATISAVAKVVGVEAKRRNKSYQKHALITMGKFVGQFNRLVDEYIGLMTTALSDKYLRDDDDGDSDDSDADGNNTMDVDARENIKFEEERLEFYKNLAVAYSGKSAPLFQFTLKATENLFHSKVLEPTWRSKLAACEVVTSVVEKAPATEVDQTFSTWKFLESICAGSNNIENIRIHYVRVSGAIARRIAADSAHKIRDSLERLHVLDPSPVVKTEVKKVLEQK
ncbi:hypothetical protein DIURU_001791 [Diutina rugosa]|uniref:Proteasome component ECM29 n=1 Tax=Diutina rugosa TaxID=5481 RepID=A0A642USM2_DIURU|nr:uncharacterized protein DIURU_001791 [Diutina rugosa]KAA8904837.1 hypothetical protein DIURU_001791 [Diutina rugosa]